MNKHETDHMHKLHQKINQTHHIIGGFHDLLNKIAVLPTVQRVIPGRISRKQKGTSHKGLSISYTTKTGFKCLLKKGGTAQELFIVCAKKHTPSLMSYVDTLTS